jgi:hypothetical protein
VGRPGADVRPSSSGRRTLTGRAAPEQADLMDTTPRVLVAYSTAAGSTAGVAERIAEALRRAGCEVACRPAGPDLDPAGVDALVLGSAVHNMAWLPPPSTCWTGPPRPLDRSGASASAR